MALIDSLLFRLRWMRWKNQQMTSMALRDWFSRNHSIDVGLYSYGCFDRWRMPGPLRIGRYCSFGNSVRVVDANHPMDGLTTHPLIYEARHGVIPVDRIDSPPLIVEDDVWVGHNSVILPGCKHIGRGAIIGAGSIVTRNVSAYAIVAGNPARQLRMRFEPDAIAAIEASRWWLLDPAQLATAERANGAVTRPLLALSALPRG
jgi:virginiamycin A acetyltransferase